MADDYIHKILKALRLNNNLTQEELAKKLNIHRTTYTKWETGVSEPNIFYIRKLVEFYKIDYNTFFYILWKNKFTNLRLNANWRGYSPSMRHNETFLERLITNEERWNLQSNKAYQVTHKTVAWSWCINYRTVCERNWKLLLLWLVQGEKS